MTPDKSFALMSAFSAELGAMTAAVEGLADLVVEHVRQNEGDARARALVGAQTVDELSQRLDALSVLAAAVARGDDLGNALDAVPLADLCERLRAAVISSGATASDRPATGDLMLFE